MASINEIIPPEVTPEAWDAAYQRAWAYFAALGIRRHFMLHSLVDRILQRTALRLAEGDPREPVVIASAEVDELLITWFRRMLEADEEDAAELSLRGRLTLLMMEMPLRWQDTFLSEPPWPPEFVAAVRHSYLRAVPELHRGRMQNQSLDLGPIPRLADAALRKLAYAQGRLWHEVGL